MAVIRESDLDGRKYMVVSTTPEDSNGAFGLAGCCWNRNGSDLERLRVGERDGRRERRNAVKLDEIGEIIIKTYRQQTEPEITAVRGDSGLGKAL